MRETSTAAWGPTARKIEPHPFIPNNTPGRNPRWCLFCDYSEDAYQHASAEERAAFDEVQAVRALTGSMPAQRERVSRRKAEIEERDWIIHALAELPGFSLEQLGTGPAPVSFRYYRGGRSVTVTVSLEGTTP